MAVRALASHFEYFQRFAGPRTRRVVLVAAAFSVLAAAATAFSLGGSDADVATEAGAHSSCAEQTWPYIEPRCLKGGNPQVRHVKETTLASAPLGKPQPPEKPTKRASQALYSDEINAAPATPKRGRNHHRPPAAELAGGRTPSPRSDSFPFFPQRQVW